MWSSDSAAFLQMLRDLGPCMNPFAAFLLIQGLETLSLRGQRHCDNAMALAKCVPVLLCIPSLIVKPRLLYHRYLETHPGVAWVSYLGLESHSSHGLAKELMRPDAYGGVLSFGVKGDVKQASQVVDSLKLASHLANVGECRT